MDGDDEPIVMGTCTRCDQSSDPVICVCHIDCAEPQTWLCAPCLAELHDTLCGVERIELPRERPTSWVEQLRDRRDLPREEVHPDEP